MQCHKLDMFIEDQSSQLTHHDFEQSYRMWSGFEIVAQLQGLDLGPQNCDQLTVNSLLKGLLYQNFCMKDTSTFVFCNGVIWM